MQSSNARAAGWTAMILAVLLFPPSGPAHAGEGLQIIASLIKAIQSPGRIDYAERINAPRREGVTPENNFFAAIFPLLRVSSLDESDGEWVQALCDEIGCVHPADEPLKFVTKRETKYEAAATEEEILAAIDAARDRPWLPADNPIAEAWIVANEDCWKRLVEAAKRSDAYRPLIPPKGMPILYSLLPDFRIWQELAALGAVRAHKAIAQNDLVAARENLITVHLMARHAGHTTGTVQLLSAYTLHSFFRTAEAHYLSHSEMTSTLRMAYLAELDRLRPMRSLRDVVGTDERWTTMDLFDFLRRGVTNPFRVNQLIMNRELQRQRFYWWLVLTVFFA